MKWEWLVTWFYLGRGPKAPGTWGTVGAIPVVFLFSLAGPLPYMAATLVFIGISIVVCDIYERRQQIHDPKHIVIDEVAGFLVAMTWVPLTWQYIVASFLLFRFFDILKPFPISHLDKNVKGGLGTVVDDLAAGLVVNILLQVYLQFLSPRLEVLL